MSVRSKVKCGNLRLVVVKVLSGTGYILAGQGADKSVTRFGVTFKLQKDALASGQTRYGTTPSIVRKK